MLQELKNLFAALDGGSSAHSVGEDELRIATAALLVHAAAVDGEIDEDERVTVAHLLEQHFATTAHEAATLLAEGEARERDAVDIYAFTRVLQQHLSQTERRRIIELLWEVTIADGEIHDFESNLVWRAAELIGVSTRDRVHLRQSALARAGTQGRG